jgi:hypothetical protein
LQLFNEPLGCDLREEMHRMLHGDYTGAGIGRPVILRQMTNTPCVCFDPKTDTGNPHCRYCQGEGYQFRETMVERMYIARSFGSVLGSATQISQQSAIASYGITDPHKAAAYAEWDVYRDYGRYVGAENKVPDRLYELEVDQNGNRVRPLRRIAKWKVKSVVPHHGDNGRVEFLELGLEKENV